MEMDRRHEADQHEGEADQREVEKIAQYRKKITVHPYDRSWCPRVLSFLTFSWMSSTLREGRRRQLDLDDMFALPSFDTSERCARRLEQTWDPKKSRSFLLSCLLAERWGLFIAAIIFVSEAVVQVLNAYLLGQITLILQREKDGKPTSDKETYLYALGISICSLLNGTFHHICFFLAQRAGHCLRTACIALVYKKSLQLSAQGANNITTGHITNLVSNDVERFFAAVPYIHFAWIGPLQTIVVAFMLWDLVGPFGLCGIGFILLLIPLHGFSSKLFARYRLQTAEKTDHRVRIMSEVLSSMRVIKMYVWEKPFANLIRRIRKQELSKVRKTQSLKASNLGFFFFASSLVSFLTFVPFVSAGNKLTAYRVFTSIALFDAVRLTMTLFFPFAVQYLSELRISCSRIERFLRLPEHASRSDDEENTTSGTQSSAFVEKDTDKQIPTPSSNTAFPVGTIQLRDVTYAWSKDSTALSNATFSIQPGSLVGIVGPVGSGKTTLFMGLLREILPTHGTATVSGRMSYASQEPWIIATSVRENILFGSEEDPSRLQKVLAACALLEDIKRLPQGLDTVIGERGVTLSGGQKARLSLARAVYRQADIYLLDDPLSAVDAKVGRVLFEDCIYTMLSGTTRLLATHQVHHLVKADTVIVLDEQGRIAAQGRYQDLVAEKCQALISQFSEQDDEDATKSDTAEDPSEKTASAEKDKSAGQEEEATPASGELFKQEDRHVGAVTARTYWQYFRLMGSLPYVIVCALAIPLVQALYIGVDIYLADWVDSPENQNSAENIGIYSGLLAALALTSMGRALLLESGFIDASRKLHDSMFEAVVASPIRFFDTNPVGRILNRFSKDTGYMDDLLPPTYIDFFQLIGSILGTIILASVINPWVLLSAAPILIIFVWIRAYFLKTAREIKRIEAVTRSPIYSHFSASLAGLATIRSQEGGPRAMRLLHAYQNDYSTAVYMFLAVSRWLGFRLDFLSFTFITCVVFTAAALRDKLEPGLVGLTLAYALRLTGSFQWCVRQSAEVESQMTSVERALEYSKLPTEADAYEAIRNSESSSAPHEHDETSHSRPSLPEDWPNAGGIILSNVSMRYAPELPPALKDLSCVIPAGSKVGIVGRTGAGKSSILATLFRLSEVKGCVSIDGIDVTHLRLDQLRPKISVIPQDPALFSGTVRYNLDPFEQYSDTELWAALETVQLKEKVQQMDGGLDGVVQEQGSNFSVGQKQLICLARALLRRNKILVIDEATAHVDDVTDRLIQETLRREFRNCTVLTIAHRLHTIMDSDMIAVMDAGRLVEYDKPYVLLQDAESYLSKLISYVEADAHRALLAAAKRHYLSVDNTITSSIV
eukprot:m.132440 g.132440  ORF g.132440 m.132440 type:complete len:1345 (+) comp15778_c0_seq1:123-4157(+)